MSDASARHVVCGYDGRPGGGDALLLGELLARTLDARLDVLTALPVDRAYPELEPDAEEALARTEVTWELTARDGRPAEVLLDVAGERSTDLLAIGSTHRAGFGRVLPGTTASRLLGATRCPVAIAPRSFAATARDDGLADALRVIEVGYDASPEAKAALAMATRLALAAAATLRVVAVANPNAAQAAGGPAGAYAVSVPFDLQQSLHDAVAELPEDLRALPIYDHGTPANILFERSTEGVDLLVVGSRGRGRVGTALLGSTSKLVVQAAACPTIVVPKPRPE